MPNVLFNCATVEFVCVSKAVEVIGNVVDRKGRKPDVVLRLDVVVPDDELVVWVEVHVSAQEDFVAVDCTDELVCATGVVVVLFFRMSTNRWISASCPNC